MDRNPPMPNRMPDLSEAMRRFLAGVRDDEIPNLELLASMRDDERETLAFTVTTFTREDMEVIRDSMENLRAIKRFGWFGMKLLGVIIAGGSAATAIKLFFVSGAAK